MNNNVNVPVGKQVKNEQEIENVCVSVCFKLCGAKDLDDLYFPPLLSFSHYSFCNTCTVSEPQVVFLLDTTVPELRE